MAEQSKALRSGRSLPWRRGFESHFWQECFRLKLDPVTVHKLVGMSPSKAKEFAKWQLSILQAQRSLFSPSSNFLVDETMCSGKHNSKGK